MKYYWYISLNNRYPYPIREATPNEIDYCKLIYCGYGHYKDKHIIGNINRHCPR